MQFYLHKFCFSRYSFIDLAQIVCKLPETRYEKAYSSSSDEDFDGYISEPNMFVSNLDFSIHNITDKTIKL